MLLRFSLLLASASLLIPEIRASLDTGPTVALPYGSFRGQVAGTITQFLGMPFAAPPYVEAPLVLCHQVSWPIIAPVNAALAFQNLPYLSLAPRMHSNLEHHALSKLLLFLRIFLFNSLDLRKTRQKIVRRMNLQTRIS